MTRTENHRRVQIGCQGWNYPDWVTRAASAEHVFYPRGTRTGQMLEMYARALTTVEVDSTFYAVPPAATVEGWRERVPQGFTFSLKLPQLITHQLALRRGSEEVLEEFCERARLLGERLACLLVQLPPQFAATLENLEALRSFLRLLPRDLRFSFEFRESGWFEESVVELLGRAGASLAFVEGNWVRRERVWRLMKAGACDFAYVRWMGARDITRFDRVVRAQEANLRAWSEQLKALPTRVSQVFAYFSNFYEGYAPASANQLKQLLGQETFDPRRLESQPTLF